MKAADGKLSIELNMNKARNLTIANSSAEITITKVEQYLN